MPIVEGRKVYAPAARRPARRLWHFFPTAYRSRIVSAPKQTSVNRWPKAVEPSSHIIGAFIMSVSSLVSAILVVPSIVIDGNPRRRTPSVYRAAEVSSPPSGS